MSRLDTISQLLKGIIIGVVLILAIIGTMSVLEQDSSLPSSDSMNSLDESATTNSNSAQSNSQADTGIDAPLITLKPNKSTDTNTTKNNNATINDLNAELADDHNNNNASNNKETISPNTPSTTTTIPVLVDEKTEEEILALANPITYGMMELSSINPDNNNAIKTNFTVFDKNNVKVAESKNTSKASYRLVTGQYKVVTTLTRIDEATKQVIPVITKSRYIIVRKNITAKQTFELEPPASTGILQVSAKMNDQVARANFIIQRENGEVVATRNNVSSSLFKLNTGTYKVSVENGANKDFRSVEVKAGESTQTVFILKAAAQQGKLLISVLDSVTKNAIRADITITNASEAVIQRLSAATKTELSLSPGDYKITVVGPNGTSNKKIRINPNQTINEVFSFEATKTVEEDNSKQDNSPTKNEDTLSSENVILKPVAENPAVDIANTNNEGDVAILNINALDELTKETLKANFYIQTPNGKHLDKKIYADNASFSLPPGTYKVTVRATNRSNSVKTIRIKGTENINETFLLKDPSKPETEISQTTQSVPKTISEPQLIPTGFLNVSMQGTPNQNLNTHFIVSTISGKKIVELTSVSAGNFKLDVGEYVVTAIYNNQRKTQRITIKPNQNTRFTFKTRDFISAASKQKPVASNAGIGILRSRIVDGSGRPLKGNLIVSNMAGKIIAQANNVSTAVFKLAPTSHTISVNYQGLSGREVVKINTDETTIQTFTIAQNP